MFTEDLSDFINPDTPGYAVASGFDAHGAAVSIGVLFDAPGITGSIGSSGMAGSQPAVLMASADVCTDPVGWELSIKSVAYVVAAADPDGAGLTRLILELA